MRQDRESGGIHSVRNDYAGAFRTQIESDQLLVMEIYTGGSELV
jgi:hypothetical protein